MTDRPSTLLRLIVEPTIAASSSPLAAHGRNSRRRLKIDKYFVHGLQADSDDAAIVGSTISLSKVLGLSVIAEGIEDGATADLLGEPRMRTRAGYYFGRPAPAAEFERKFLSGDAVTTPASSGAKRVASNATRSSGATTPSQPPDRVAFALAHPPLKSA